jgi:hypothetical protein
VLDKLEGLFELVGHIRHVPMGDVGSQHGTEPAAVGMKFILEGDRIGRIISFASVVEVGLEKVAKQLRPLDF